MFSIKLVGERRTLAMLGLGFCSTLFGMIALLQGGEWLRCMGAMAIVYGVGFFGLGAEWFWARWYAVGIATSGLTSAALGLVTGGWNGAVAVWGGIHLLIYLPLFGRSMVARYEGQQDWQKRFGLGESSVARIQKSVKGAATALPTMIMYTLAPRSENLAMLPAVALLVLGLYGVTRMRSWGVLALVGATVYGAVQFLGYGSQAALQSTVIVIDPLVLGSVSVGALLCASAPMLGPIWRGLRTAH